MILPRIFSGGTLKTNGYLLETEAGVLCFDAPEGMARELVKLGVKPVALLLTHGHFDHVWDAAQVQDYAQCPVYLHSADLEMVQDPSYTAMFGLAPYEKGPADINLFDIPNQGESEFLVQGETFQLFHIPGHSPGSVCFYHARWGLLFGGDVLFCGGVGRWDLPGGSRHQLLSGLQKHVVKLPKDTRVFAGHGPSTTIGYELETNPYLEMI